MKTGSALGIAIVWCVATMACGSSQPGNLPKAARQISPPPASLPVAIGKSVHLGSAGAGTEVYLTLGLKGRQPERLAALLAAGKTVSSAEYAAEFGPDPALAQGAVDALLARGFRATWRPGSSLIAADGPAPNADRLLGIDIENYRLADGTTFYATLETARIPTLLAPIVSSVTGLDSYTRLRSYAVRPGGMTPTDVLLFYNLKALRDRGLDGSGQTVVLPEIDDLPNLNDLNQFAAKYGLAPFDGLVTVKRDPNWGTPMKPVGETVLDLEMIHQIAPKAKMVVYLSAPNFGEGTRALDQLVTDHLGSIISESLGQCEPDLPSGARDLVAGIENRAVAQGMTHFVSSGDSGAYTCGEDKGAAASFPSTLPTVTCVGGTTVFESVQGTYYKETAWGNPIEESGTGGGVSAWYTLPDYQKGVAQAAGHGMRQVPDVAAGADWNSGFHIFFDGKDEQIGGTSAAAPLWAGTMALINQDLKKHGLRVAGFANPAIYWMGQNSSKLPAPPFHDVTTGNNLLYGAGPGWDFATGWGSMDAAALDQAWILYIKGGGA